MTLGIIASSRRSRATVTIIQSASGSTGAAGADTVTATLGSAPTAGNSLLLFVCSDSTIPTPPTGFVLDKSAVQSCATYVYRKQTSAGTETSVVVDPTGSAPRSTWVYAEVSGLADLPVGATAMNKSSTAMASASTGTTMATEDQVDGYAFAVHGWLVISGAGPTTTGQTGGFTELADVNTTVASGQNVALAVSTQRITADATFSSTGTPSVSAKPAAILITYRPDVPAVAPGPGEFTHGSQLTTTNVGLPTSWTPTSTSGATTITTDDDVIEDVRYTALVTVNASNVTFTRCKFEGGVTNGENPAYTFTIEDSEIGIAAPALIERNNGCVGNCSYTLRRCYVHDIAEGPRTQYDVLLEECYIHRLVPFGDNPHTDAVQLDGNNSIDGLPDVIVRRCYIDGRWRGFTGVDDWGSAAIISNGKDPDGNNGPPDCMRNMHMEVLDCYLAGGDYTLRLEDANTTWDNTYTATGNVFERGSYKQAQGTHNTSDSIPANITWNHNTFHDNGEQIPL